MKTLINKANPEIRITAPDITLENHCYYIWTDDGDCIIEFWEKDWTLVEEYYVPNLNNGTFTFVNTEEEQKPVEWSEEDENNIGKLHRLLVICQSEKKFIPTSEYEKLDKWLKSLRPQSKEEQKPVDLEKLALEKYPIQVAYLEGLKKGYELGLKARKEE